MWGRRGGEIGMLRWGELTTPPSTIPLKIMGRVGQFRWKNGKYKRKAGKLGGEGKSGGVEGS